MVSPRNPIILNINKPVGMSSFEVIRHFKKNLDFNYGKIGHFGTLDPFAEGVLLIGLLGAQKINDYVHSFLPKKYRAYGSFGHKTLTGDHTSEFCGSQNIDPKWLNISQIEMEQFLKSKFLGEYWQSPHSFSAVKHNGKRLYELAREGIMVKKESVKRNILDFKLLSFDKSHMEFEVTVSSGTYVRTLFEDIAIMLGGLGHLLKLQRLSIGHLGVHQSLMHHDWPLKGIKDLDLNYSWNIDQVLPFDKIFLDERKAFLYKNGVRLRRDQLTGLDQDNLNPSENFLWVYDLEGRLMGLSNLVNNELNIKFNLP